ncbi:MAG TPA: tripartite tricarboxylate transporter substrate binding protein [Ramlibacter sp.]|jgi:tripartite-type tricarboxylate transporter receptor subunit TctC|uniref:Bug family tripartite tricarboxylate transporter substrate binding protein n=1 Tax=Ramlibacter sp. TaxID=1917967 RepID=UPI002D5C4DBE|nr:tripartite tricarboxylate transporter substrate binding protein [Ramlibacter sp.]HZY19655.1 tripartite tricarboxylate transporter substrate binding protein [Ramlibacter sp.]
MTMKPLLTRRGLGVLAAAALAFPAWAQEWTPTQPITILVGFAPGGSADQIARQLSFAAKGIIPVPVLVVNKVGAAGAIAAQATAEAKPDGYTLFVGGGSETTAVGNFKPLPYDPRKSFTPVIKVSRAPSILAVRADSKFTDMKALLAEARQAPEKVSYGSTGEGGIFHATGLVWEKQAGIKLLHVPYKGAADSMNALLGGQVDSAFGAYEEMKPMIDAGRVRPLALFSRTRLPALPQVPTMIEVGVPVALDNMKGLMGPAGLPAPVVRYLHDSFRKAMQTDAWKDYVAKSGLTQDYADGAAFQKEVVEAYDLIGKAIAR